MDKIYSKATGVSYPVCAAGHNNAQPTPTPDPEPPTPVEPELGDTMTIEYDKTTTSWLPVPPRYYNVVLQCTGEMPSGKTWHMSSYNEVEHFAFDIYLIPDTEDPSKLVIDHHNDSQSIEGTECEDGDYGTITTVEVIDTTTYEVEETLTVSINWTCSEHIE